MVASTTLVDALAVFGLFASVGLAILVATFVSRESSAKRRWETKAAQGVDDLRGALMEIRLLDPGTDDQMIAVLGPDGRPVADTVHIAANIEAFLLGALWQRRVIDEVALRAIAGSLVGEQTPSLAEYAQLFWKTMSERQHITDDFWHASPQATVARLMAARARLGGVPVSVLERVLTESETRDFSRDRGETAKVLGVLWRCDRVDAAVGAYGPQSA